MASIEAIQGALRDAGMDAWLFYDHHGRDPLGYRVLGLPPAAHVTRRWYYVVPAHGEPRKLVHRIEAGKLDALPGAKAEYSSWGELDAQLAEMLAPYTRVAMQYSPRNAIMYVSMVDAGTVEVLRGLGKEVVSSADLIAQFEAVLTAEQIASHDAASERIDRILPEAWRWLREGLNAGREVTEYTMQTFLAEAMRREGLDWENGPNVSAGANSADSHYDPGPERWKPIREGDFLLVDIWGQMDTADSVYYDITWTGTVGRAATEKEQAVFAAVSGARDAAIERVKQAFEKGEPIAGWQADDAARAVIAKAGYAELFTHRTGHNIGHEIHGAGAHLDNLETHDERRLLPFTCFSVEPGVYLTGKFGIRSEVNLITSANEARVTGRLQTELLRF